MQTKNLHSWNLSCSQAIDLQKRLASKVQFIPLKKPPKLIAGLDCAFTKNGQKIIAAAVVVKLPDFELIETTTALRKITFPYIPGLLSFREAPACIAAVEKLKKEPDAFIIDGQGIAHPRRLGLAAHLGLFFDKPTIGCAKSRLTGYFKDPPSEKGAYTLLKDKKGMIPETSHGPKITNHEVIGAVVRSRSNIEPLFVSVGNKCLLKDAIKITLDCAIIYGLPVPSGLAHLTVSLL